MWPRGGCLCVRNGASRHTSTARSFRLHEVRPHAACITCVHTGVPGNCQVPGTWFLVPGPRYLVQASRFQAPGARYHIHTWYQEPDFHTTLVHALQIKKIINTLSGLICQLRAHHISLFQEGSGDNRHPGDIGDWGGESNREVVSCRACVRARGSDA